MFHTDTIAAISTGMTSSGIGIIRISGPEAIAIADKVYDSRSGKKLENMPTHTIHYTIRSRAGHTPPLPRNN